MTQVKIGTHDESFHCDDVLACVMLKMLPEYKNADIIRTKHKSLLDTCDIVVDVGGVFDHSKKRYDHHQHEFDKTMKSISQGKLKYETKLSSAGLVYWFYGKSIICHFLKINAGQEKAKLEYIFESAYKFFIKEIDHLDNHGGGKNSWTGLTARVGRLRPKWDDETQNFKDCFNAAYNLVKSEFIDCLREFESIWRARNIWKEKLNQRETFHRSGRVLILDKWIPGRDDLNRIQKELEIQDDETILYIVTPDPGHDRYTIKCTNTKYEEGNNKTLFPQKWRGKENVELEKITKIPGSKYVHAGGWTAASDTIETALKMIDFFFQNQN